MEHNQPKLTIGSGNQAKIVITPSLVQVIDENGILRVSLGNVK